MLGFRSYKRLRSGKVEVMLGSIMFHVRRRPADCAPRKRKKKPGALGGPNTSNARDVRGDLAPILVELGPDGSAPLPVDTARTIRLNTEVMEVGSANGIALQLYGPHIQPRHCVITNTEGVTSLTPCHADAYTYVNGQRIHQTTILTHGSLVKFGHSNTYRFLDPAQEDRTRQPGALENVRTYDRSPRALTPTESNRENFETNFDLEGNVETISTASGARDDSRSLGSASENRLGSLDRYPRGQDPILPAVLEFPEEPQEQFLARVITHLDVSTPTFRLAPAYTLYLCARYRASTHYRPELTPTERAHKLTLLLQHAAMLVRHTVQDRSTESTSQAFWLANASELHHFLKSDRHVSAFSVQAQDTLADSVQLAFRNLVACLTDELNAAMPSLMSDGPEDNPREIINILSGAMNLLRKCRVNAALTIQLFSQSFHWISARSLSTIINNPSLCTRTFGMKLFNRLRNLQAWAESQGLELAAEVHLAKIIQCAHLLQAPKFTAEELANLSSACFKLNSLQLRALLAQYKGDVGEQVAPPQLLEQAARAAESVADELARAEGREVRLHEDPAPPLQLLLPDDGFSCDVVQGVPPGLADFLHPLQASGLCRLAAQPTSSGHWTVYMSAPRPPSALSTTQPEVQVIRLHKAGGGMGLSIVAAKGAGQERLGIYIKSVVPGGAADRDGRLAAGDQLLSVDGQSLLGITQEKAAEFLVRTGSIVTLEVAKGGAVYHGLATLLQQPSPTPHRAMDSPDRYRCGSQDSLYSNSSLRLFTPPPKQKSNFFFNSDDSLYKAELKRVTIPRIEIQIVEPEPKPEPEFKFQITDFSEPDPKDLTYVYGEVDAANFESNLIESQSPRRSKPNPYNRKSYSLDVNDIPFIDVETDMDQFLNADTRRLKSKFSSSLQDVSSSTSSINSAVHESNLDLSQLDLPVKQKNWKSPDEIREGRVRSLARKFEGIAVGKGVSSFPNLENIPSFMNLGNMSSIPNLKDTSSVLNLKLSSVETSKGVDKSVKFKSNSEQNLKGKLTEFERLELLKLLHDWSTVGSGAKSSQEFSLKNFFVGDKDKGIGKEDKRIRKEDERIGKDKRIGREDERIENEDNEIEKECKNIRMEEERQDEENDSKKHGQDFFYGKTRDKNRSKSYGKYFRTNLESASFAFSSEPDLSPKTRARLDREGLVFVTKYKSESNVSSSKVSDCDFSHKCEFRNCIFNVDFEPTQGTNSEVRPRGILKNSAERLDSGKNLVNSTKSQVKDVKVPFLENETFSGNRTPIFRNKTPFLENKTPVFENKTPIFENKTPIFENKTPIMGDYDKILEKKYETTVGKNIFIEKPIVEKKVDRRHSEIIPRPFNNQLVRCDSLERLANNQRRKNHLKKFPEFTYYPDEARKKFPEAYVITKRNSMKRSKSAKYNNNNNETYKTVPSTKIVVLRKKYVPKPWKSCSDIKTKQRTIRKCCRYAKKTCPLLKVDLEPERKAKSCVDFVEDDLGTVKVEKKDSPVRMPQRMPLLQRADWRCYNRPRRMSERDLPSRVDAERTIPSSKSVPALHHISPGSEQPRSGGPHDVFNPGYSRTSSNNSINTNSVAGPAQNGTSNTTAMRSRSTHNLNQQDAGFYQNLSVYRNKMPSPQQLGDRTSALRSSQNSLQSNLTNSQRPASAYYPPTSGPSTARPNLHQSIPNLKSPPLTQRIQAEESRSGSYPSVNQYQQSYGQPYAPQNATYPGHGQNFSPTYPRSHEEINNKYPGQNFVGQREMGSYPSPSHSGYMGNLQQPLHINANGPRPEEQSVRYNNTGLLREDVFRHSQGARSEEMLRYPSTSNVRIQEAQIQQNKMQDDFSRNNEMRTSKSEDLLRQHTAQADMLRYASSGNIRAQESNKVDIPQLRQGDNLLRQGDSQLRLGDAQMRQGDGQLRQGESQMRLGENQMRQGESQMRLSEGQMRQGEGQMRLGESQMRLGESQMRQNESQLRQGEKIPDKDDLRLNLRGQAKMAEMGEEVRRRQNQSRVLSPPQQHFHSPTNNPYVGQHQHFNQQGFAYGPTHLQMAQNTQSMQNLSLGQGHYSPHGQQGYPGYYGTPTSPNYPKTPPVAPKPARKMDEVPEPPPTSTHPLFSGPQDPKLYMPNSKMAKDPWAREEQERQAEVRREHARFWQEQQIRELMSMPNRSQQQEEQLRVLQLEREFQRRALEAEQDDDDTEKESPTHYNPQPVSSTTVTTTLPSAIASTKQEPPTSILKPGIQTQSQPPPPQEVLAPPPPERGSSYAVMSMRAKEGTKRVSFNDASATPQPPATLHLEETVREREDPNSFIRQAESMLASPTTPTDSNPGSAQATPGVIGAQEVYRDPRTRRLQEQAQQKLQTPVPEKLSFKEKMKMFAMETGEQETPKDKSKISRAQRDIDNIGSPNSSLVH